MNGVAVRVDVLVSKPTESYEKTNLVMVSRIVGAVRAGLMNLEVVEGIGMPANIGVEPLSSLSDAKSEFEKLQTKGCFDNLKLNTEAFSGVVALLILGVIDGLNKGEKILCFLVLLVVLSLTTFKTRLFGYEKKQLQFDSLEDILYSEKNIEVVINAEIAAVISSVNAKIAKINDEQKLLEEINLVLNMVSVLRWLQSVSKVSVDTSLIIDDRRFGIKELIEGSNLNWLKQNQTFPEKAQE